jgi:hypothetical protein
MAWDFNKRISSGDSHQWNKALRRHRILIWASSQEFVNAAVKSSYYSSHSKEPNPQQAEQGHAQIQLCVQRAGSASSEFDIGRRTSRCPGVKNATRVPPSLCNATQTSDPANSPPCACRARLRDVCSTRPIRTAGPEPQHPHVCGPHVALEVGDHLVLFTIRRRSQVSLFLARVGRTCTR